ncbi:hypothetical protein [Streptomyces sp. NPDC059224]|uniref:hypothetical protein n=1 Tax=Streptomyces sp. NPDC059224 TaxID=3346775 RepID=UPI0036AF3FE3
MTGAGLVASTRPRTAPGNGTDAHVWPESDRPAAAARTAVIADGACLGTGLIVPHRRRPGRPLLRGPEEDDAEPGASTPVPSVFVSDLAGPG